jgi:hypothetical protein
LWRRLGDLDKQYYVAWGTQGAFPGEHQLDQHHGGSDHSATDHHHSAANNHDYVSTSSDGHTFRRLGPRTFPDEPRWGE